MSDFYWVVPYFTLPEFPENCDVVSRNDLLIRDVFCCYPGNKHIFLGGQYDPHYENPISPEFKMCHPNVRNAIYEMSQNGNVDNIYLVFRANKIHQDRSNTHFLMGYYKIDQENVRWDYDYDDPTLYASEFRLLNESNAIDVTSFVNRVNYYYPFSSDAGGGSHIGFILNCIQEMRDKENDYADYVSETHRLENLFKYFEFEDGIYDYCVGCGNHKKCPLIKRINSKGKLYNSLPPKISQMIRDHYKAIEA